MGCVDNGRKGMEGRKRNSIYMVMYILLAHIRIGCLVQNSGIPEYKTVKKLGERQIIHRWNRNDV